MPALSWSEPGAQHWRRLRVEPVGYPIMSGTHSALADAVDGWASWASMGLLDHRQQVEQLLSRHRPEFRRRRRIWKRSSPPLVRSDSSPNMRAARNGWRGRRGSPYSRLYLNRRQQYLAARGRLPTGLRITT